MPADGLGGETLVRGACFGLGDGDVTQVLAGGHGEMEAMRKVMFTADVRPPHTVPLKYMASEKRFCTVR